MPSKLIEPLPDQPFKTLTLRLPVDLYTQVATLAQKERRTLHSQLLVLLEHALQPSAEELDPDDPRRQ